VRSLPSIIVLIIISYSFIRKPLGQKRSPNVGTPFIIRLQSYESKIVKSCHANSSVVNMSAKMEVSKTKLPKAVNNMTTHNYALKYKGKDVKFSYSQEANYKLSVWVNNNEKHCFTIDSRYKYSFNSYFISKEGL
jgi:hypothetical protein